MAADIKTTCRYGAVGLAWRTVRDFGASWVLRRGWYELQLRSGWHARRFCQRTWDADELARWRPRDAAGDSLTWAQTWKVNRQRHFVDAAVQAPDRATRLRALLGAEGEAALCAEAEAALRGSLRYFSDRFSAPQAPFDWHRNPFTGQTTSPTMHWTRVPMASVAGGDLKFIWEPGRFAVAYLFVRAWAVSGDERYAEGFWHHVESWAAANPPNTGAQWKCGQETSLRIIAWAFALHAFADSPATTPARVARLAGMMAAQAARVAADHIYSHLQTNNHSISEGVGLWTVGLLLPDFAAAPRWRELGRKILEQDAVRLINADGSFSQKSINYHRLMLQDYLYAVRLGAANGEKFSAMLQTRLRAATELLAGLVDAESGRAPNFGANDGALIVPLNSCGYDDFRPVHEAAQAMFGDGTRFPSGPWHEDLFWFYGPNSPVLAAPPAVAQFPPALSAREGGCYTLRGKSSWAFVHCQAFKDRPGHADALHVDLWRRGENVALDAGTYQYFADSPWDNPLGTALVHNTVTLDGCDQMERGPRFTWVDWLRAEARHCVRDPGGRVDYFEGEHNGYARLPEPVTHRRAVLRVSDDLWVIVDDLVGVGEHEARLHWLLADAPHESLPGGAGVRLALQSGPYELRVLTPVANEGAVEPLISSGDAASPLGGWQSRHYGRREPAVAVSWTVRACTPLRFISIFCPPDTAHSLAANGDGLVLSRPGVSVQIALGPCGASPIITSAGIKDGGAGLRTFSFIP